MINVNLLPKTLRRSKKLDSWKGVAVAVPVIVFVTCGFLQLQAASERGRLTEQNAQLQNEKAVLQPFVAEQAALETERSELAGIESVAETVRTGRIFWSRQLYAMLETRPSPGPKVASRMAFTTLEMRALDEATRAQLASANTYEGLAAVAEMSVSGIAGSAGVIAEYLRELQRAPNFAVSLGDLSQDPETNFYTFNLTIGAARLGQSQAEQTAQAAAQSGNQNAGRD